MNMSLQNALQELELERYRAVSAEHAARHRLGQAGASYAILGERAEDLRKSIKLGTQRIMSTAGKLVDIKAKMLVATETSLTYKQAIDSVLAADPDLKRAYTEGR